MRTLRLSFLTYFSFILFVSCASLYDQITYTETVETKTQTLNLMDVSSQPYPDHEAKVIALKNKINQRWQYEKGKEKNQITVKMWNALRGDEGMIGSYLNLWKKKGTMRAVFISEAKTQVEEAFKILLEYEKKKDTTNENKILDFISNL